jgi:fluoride exporter
VLLVAVFELLPPGGYLRPALGIGFFGALTTFGTVTVSVDELAAHGRPALAVGYLLGSAGAGLTAAAAGIVLGRAITTDRAVSSTWQLDWDG